MTSIIIVIFPPVCLIFLLIGQPGAVLLNHRSDSSSYLTKGKKAAEVSGRKLEHAQPSPAGRISVLSGFPGKSGTCLVGTGAGTAPAPSDPRGPRPCPAPLACAAAGPAHRARIAQSERGARPRPPGAPANQRGAQRRGPGPELPRGR